MHEEHDPADGATAGLQLRLIGDVALSRDGAPVPLPASRKTRALFAYLVLDQRAHRRERLCDLFWDLPDDPRGALRWSLSKIRGMLGEDAGWLTGDRDHVRLTFPRERIDAARIERLTEGGSEAAIVAAAKGAIDPPLGGIDLPNLDSYSAWLTAARGAIDAVRAPVLRAASRVAGLASGLAARFAHAATEAGDTSDEAGADAAASVSAFAESALPVNFAVEQTVRYCFAADRVRIAYACTGRGPPLVKAANWLNHLERDWVSPAWGEMVRSLSNRRMLVRYDSRGNGLSEWGVPTLGFDDFVADLETVVDHLGIERFPLIGVSQGCAVSIEYAARHPERVAALVLIGGYAAGWRATADAAVTAQREAIITLVRHGWGEDNPVYRQLFTHTFMPTATPEEIEWFNEFQRLTTSAENAVRFLKTFADIDVRHRLAEIAVPTLVLHARGDQRVALPQGIELAAAIPGASLVTLDSENHMPLAREPASVAMLEHIHAFLGGLPD